MRQVLAWRMEHDPATAAAAGGRAGRWWLLRAAAGPVRAAVRGRRPRRGGQRRLVRGGDWLLAGADGFSRLDVRIQLLTDDGAAIYGTYCGLLETNARVQAALSDPKSGTDFGDHYFRTTPRFETGDPRYAWMNQTLFVSEGRMLPGPIVQYRCYRVA